MPGPLRLGLRQERAARDHLTLLAELDRIALWQQQATARATDLGGLAPGRLIAALAARPYAITADLAEAAALRRDTAERLLPKLQDRALYARLPDGGGTGSGRWDERCR